MVWFALVFQFYLQSNSGVAAKGELLVRFFSYFTIDSNLLVAICCTAQVLFPNKKIGIFFAKPGVQTATAVYIVVVALIYNLILRFLWTFSGWGMIINELLHVIVPLAFLVHWAYFVIKDKLKFSNVALWLIYPLFYTIFVLVRGSYANFYPYPFLNVNELGYQRVLINCIMITLLFALLAIVFVAIGKRQSKRLKP